MTILRTIRRATQKSRAARGKTYVPRWLRPISKLYSSMAGNVDDEDADNDDADNDDSTMLILPPGAPSACASIRDADVACMYRTLAYWCVDFDDVPDQFIARWFDCGERAQLMEQMGAFRAELHETEWVCSMLHRDDARMLAVALRAPRSTGIRRRIDGHLNTTHHPCHLVTHCIITNAVRCLDLLCSQVLPINCVAKHLGAWLREIARFGNLQQFKNMLACRIHCMVQCGRRPQMTVLEANMLILQAVNWGRIHMLEYFRELSRMTPTVDDESTVGYVHGVTVLYPFFATAATAATAAFFKAAACRGNMETLAWLRANACARLVGAQDEEYHHPHHVPPLPYSRENTAAKIRERLTRCEYIAYYAAAGTKRLDVLEWLWANNWALGDIRHDEDLIVAAATSRKVLQWLVDRGAVLTRNRSLVWSAIHSPDITDDDTLIDHLDWLHQTHQCVPCQHSVYEVRDRSPKVLQWILDRIPGGELPHH